MEKQIISVLQLKADYSEMTIDEILEKYQLCRQRLYNLLDECEIPRKRIREPRRPPKKIVLQD